MADTKLTANELLIKEKIDNYIINSKELIRLQERYEKYKDMNSNGTVQYGTEMTFGGMPVSRVENMAIQKMIIEEQIKNISKEIHYISIAVDRLKGLQETIVRNLIAGYKMSEIARKLDISRKKADLLRKRAFGNIYNTFCELENTK